MPHPNYLRIMGAKLHQYNALSTNQKERFNREAQKRLDHLQNTDMESYIELTNAPELPAEDLIDDNEEGRYF
jgi:hypothetical protein